MDPARVVALLRELGVDYPAEFRTIEHMPFEAGVKTLEALKERVRKNYRRLAFELHPDRTGNDSEKTAQFKALTEMYRMVEKVTLRQPPPRPMPVMVTYNTTPSYPVNYVASYSASTPTGSFTMRPVFFVQMRPI